MVLAFEQGLQVAKAPAGHRSHRTLRPAAAEALPAVIRTILLLRGSAALDGGGDYPVTPPSPSNRSGLARSKLSFHYSKLLAAIDRHDAVNSADFVCALMAYEQGLGYESESVAETGFRAPSPCINAVLYPKAF